MGGGEGGRSETRMTATFLNKIQIHNRLKQKRTQELCESEGGRPGLPSLINIIMISVHVKKQINSKK